MFCKSGEGDLMAIESEGIQELLEIQFLFSASRMKVVWSFQQPTLHNSSGSIQLQVGGEVWGRYGMG